MDWIQNLSDTIREAGLNKYDLAVMSDEGIQYARLQPGNRCSNSYSVAKAFTMTAVGMLWDEGKLDLEDSIADIMGFREPAWRQVTVHHALTHRIGYGKGLLDIDVDDVRSYGTQDYLSYALHQALPFAPGERRVYTDAAYYILSRLVTRLTGRGLDDFLIERLFAPMEFAEMAWSRCPMGYCMGATGLYISAEDMVKLGWLYANDGVYSGTRLISGNWVRLALDRAYEFAPLGDTGLVGKGGMYGQMLLFDREKRMAAAWHGFDETGDQWPLIRMIARGSGSSPEL